MTQEQALNFIEKNNIQLDEHKSVVVTSDNGVYIDSELEPIKAHCEAHGKTYFVVKSDVKEAVVKAVLNEEIKSETPKKVKAKK